MLIVYRYILILLILKRFHFLIINKNNKSYYFLEIDNHFLIIV